MFWAFHPIKDKKTYASLLPSIGKGWFWGARPLEGRGRSGMGCRGRGLQEGASQPRRMSLAAQTCLCSRSSRIAAWSWHQGEMVAFAVPLRYSPRFTMKTKCSAQLAGSGRSPGCRGAGCRRVTGRSCLPWLRDAGAHVNHLACAVKFFREAVYPCLTLQGASREILNRQQRPFFPKL